ncbi:MAG: acetyl-CoA carboxylase biotin carboxyl carrier protein [Saprospiraceae bacterium]
MDYKEIQNLIKLINDSNIAEFKLINDDIDLTIRTKDYHKKAVFAPPTNLNYQPVPQTVITHQETIPNNLGNTDSDLKAVEKTSEPVSKNNVKEIKSPIVGTFYRSPSPDKEPYVKIGDNVSEKTTVCIVEAMKLFNEIEAELSGKIVDILVEDGSPVEYDQVLFLVETKN